MGTNGSVVLNERAVALQLHLDLNIYGALEIKQLSNEAYEFGGNEYLVMTDAEADAAAEENIRDSLWAFRASFLCQYMPGNWDCMKIAIEAMQEKHCENCNDTLAGMIDDRMERFISDAISANGRGHFMNTYDGDEHESACGNYYIYRIN